MLRHLFLLCLLALLFGCQKTRERIAENMIIKAMTDGQWRMTKFVKGGTDITTDFTTYRFQFRSNNTVEAINNGRTEKTGTWSADANARTITSTFNNASAPIMLLNGTWLITKNSWTYVEAQRTANGEVLFLRLDK